MEQYLKETSLLDYNQHQQQLSFIQEIMFKNIVRHLMNKNVDNIRNAKIAE
ncbi:hypothetical protein [Acinetobacter tibetensis]|jgi:hypothetical protein|uniref:Uncharacterized protein n=1 Tax=Acinetobacter tibetensis TaxID=2943497 RepID=A0AAE9LTJ0_9GAMM|nr:hypothetical protein [Acinetobacter tibetensis]USE84369.1 hypothetical protein M5E07_06095 [Acinetobacter tibetensis]